MALQMLMAISIAQSADDASRAKLCSPCAIKNAESGDARLHSYYAALLAGSVLLRVRVQLTDMCSSAERDRLHALKHRAAFSDVRKQKYRV